MGPETWGFPTITALHILYFSFLGFVGVLGHSPRGVPCVIVRWNIGFWDLGGARPQCQSKALSLSVHIPPLTLPPFQENASFFLSPTGMSSTPQSETLNVPNPQRSFYDLLNPVLFSLIIVKALFSYPLRRQEKIFTFHFSEAAKLSGFPVQKVWVGIFNHTLETPKWEVCPRLREASSQSATWDGAYLGHIWAQLLWRELWGEEGFRNAEIHEHSNTHWSVATSNQEVVTSAWTTDHPSVEKREKKVWPSRYFMMLKAAIPRDDTTATLIKQKLKKIGKVETC